MARLTKLIKRFEFNEETRQHLAIDSDARLNSENASRPRLQLKADSLGRFPTTANIKVATWIARPEAVKAWAGFEVVDVQTEDEDGTALTSCGYRLSDGTSNYWWNGAAWVVNAINWNTEAEVATNIGDFPATARALGIVINLVTTDNRYTPEVREIKVLYEAQIDFKGDLLMRTLARALREGVRPISETIQRPGAVASFTLSVAGLGAPYDVVDVDAVYNHTADPDHMEDILGSYNAGTKVVTLIDTPAGSDDLWIRFIYRPSIDRATSGMYTELMKIPAIVIEGIGLINSAETAQEDSVVNRSLGRGWKVPAPLMADIEFTLRCLTDKAQDQDRMVDEVKRWFANNQVITSRGLDEGYRLWLIGEGADQERTQEAVHAGLLRARLVRALFFLKPAVEVFTVQRLVYRTGT
jgi:hypothetical protein